MLFVTPDEWYFFIKTSKFLCFEVAPIFPFLIKFDIRKFFFGNHELKKSYFLGTIRKQLKVFTCHLFKNNLKSKENKKSVTT